MDIPSNYFFSLKIHQSALELKRFFIVWLMTYISALFRYLDTFYVRKEGHSNRCEFKATRPTRFHLLHHFPSFPPTQRHGERRWLDFHQFAGSGRRQDTRKCQFDQGNAHFYEGRNILFVRRMLHRHKVLRRTWGVAWKWRSKPDIGEEPCSKIRRSRYEEIFLLTIWFDLALGRL